jgi:hypothetical protein
MEPIRKNIIVTNREFFFDADDILEVHSDFSPYLTHNQVRFVFYVKPKKLILVGDIELNTKYVITYYSKKDERKLKLKRLNKIKIEN